MREKNFFYFSDWWKIFNFQSLPCRRKSRCDSRAIEKRRGELKILIVTQSSRRVGGQKIVQNLQIIRRLIAPAQWGMRPWTRPRTMQNLWNHWTVPKYRRSSQRNKINQYQSGEWGTNCIIYENCYLLLFGRAKASAIVPGLGRGEPPLSPRTASELWSCKSMMWKRFIIYLNNTQLFFIDTAPSVGRLGSECLLIRLYGH